MNGRASPTPLSAGAELISGDGKVGAVVSTAGDIALAVVSLDLQNLLPQTNESPAADEASLDIISWSTQPLRAGLAR